MNLLGTIEKLGQPIVIALGFALVGAIGIVDYLSGYELGFSVFYVLPISLVTWSGGRQIGLLVALVSALVWISVDIAAGHEYQDIFSPVWNTCIRLSFFIIITWLLAALSEAHNREAELARKDSLTGAANTRFFYVLAQMELDRLERYKRPFSLAYIDLDNFKTVNDKFGHHVGDQVLRTLVTTARNYLRKSDVIARLGGDEFAVLLPETNEESARVTLAKINAGLLEQMQQAGWSVTFSIGVLTCNTAPATIDELVRIADELMYSVKREGKNAIRYDTYAG